MKKIKIIAFDSWTVGSIHFQRLVDEFTNRGYEFVFVHVGTWGSDVNRASEEKIEKIHVRDISFYPKKTLIGILDYEKPDIVIFLSIQTFIHRAFNRYCLSRGIKTIHMYHGLINIYPETGFEIVNKKAYRIFVLSKIGKVILTVFPVYAISLLKTGGTWSDWKRFISDTYKMALGIKNKKGSKDSLTSKCAVFIEADVSHPVNYYGFLESNVVVIGNPDLIRFSLVEDQLNSWKDNVADRKKTIMYIDTGSIELGLFFNGSQDFLDHLIKTSKSLFKDGYQMQIKLKPSAFYGLEYSIFSQILVNNNIELIDNETFIEALNKVSACIVETTTVALIPALLGVPILLAKYGKLCNLGFGQVLTGYPKSRFLYSLDNVSQLLNEIKLQNDEKILESWIENNSGPLPSQLIDKRMADLIQELI